MNIRDVVLKEKELNDKIQFYIDELETIVDLMTIEKYKNSETLIKKYELLEERAFELIDERNKLKNFIEATNNSLKGIM